MGQETNTINVQNSYIIKPSGDDIVTLPVKNISMLGSDSHLFNISGGLIVYDVKFSLGEGLETPNYYLFSSYENGYFRLENCVFERAAVPNSQEATPLPSSLIYGGNTYNKMCFNLVSCKFSGITADASLVYDCGGGISFCKFKDITLTNGNGAVCNLQSASYLAVVGTSFENCVCNNGNGGALYIRGINYLILGEYKDQKTTFVNCKAKNATKTKNVRYNQDRVPEVGYGGAVYLDFSYMYVLNLTNVDFESGDKNTADTSGNCLYVVCPYLKEYWVKKNVKFMDDVADDSEDYKFCLYGDYINNYNLKDLYRGKIDEGADPLYLRHNGNDGNNNNCSSADKPCLTFVYALSTVKFRQSNIRIVDTYRIDYNNILSGVVSSVRGNGDMATVTVDNGYLYPSGNVTIEKLKFSVEDLSAYGYIIKIDQGTKVTLKDLVFTPEQSGRITVVNVVYVSVRDVTMSNCNISNFGTNELSSGNFPVYLKGQSVSVSKCTFDNLINTNGEGGGLRVSVGGYTDVTDPYNPKYVRSKLSIKDCTFKSCIANKGGAFYLEVDDIPSSIKVSGNTFDNNKVEGYDCTGSDIYVHANYLPSVVTSSSFSFLKDRNDDDNTTWGKYDELGRYMNLVVLVKGLRNTKKLYFGDGGKENAKCTNSGDDRCSSLDMLSDYYYYYNSSTVYIVKDLTLKDDSAEIGYVNYTLEGEGDDGTLAFDHDSSLSVSFSSKFNNLNVRFNDGCSASGQFIYIECYETQFSNVAFKSQSDNTRIEKNIFKIKSAKITFSDCTFSNLYYYGSARLFTASREGVCDKLEFSIKGGTFEKCTSVGNGGGLYISSSSSVSYHIGDGKTTTFNSCSAECGGAIYVSLSNFDDEIVFDKLAFDDNNKATKTHGSRILFSARDNLELADYSSIFKAIKGEDKVDHQYDAVYCILSDETKIVCYSIIDIINGDAKKGESVLYVGKDGVDGERTCKNTGGDLCGSFSYAMDKVIFDIANISVVGDFTSGNTDLSYKKVDISGESDTSKIITNDDSLFSPCVSATIRDITICVNSIISFLISSIYGSLTLSSVIFTLGKDIPFTGPFVCAMIFSESGGYATSNIVMEKCKISDIVRDGGSSPVMAMLGEGGSLDIKGCEFVNCKTNEGNAGAVMVSLCKGSFTVGKSGGTKSVFKGCAATCDPKYRYVIIWKEGGANFCENGNGGAIGIGIIGEKPKKLKISGVTFGGSKDGEANVANCGYDIFIQCSGVKLKDIATDDNFPYVSDMSDSYDGLMGIDGQSIDEFGEIEVKNAAKMVRDSGFPLWALILIIVLAVVVVIVIVVIIIVCCCCCRKKKVESSDGNGEKSSAESTKVSVDSD